MIQINLINSSINSLLILIIKRVQIGVIKNVKQRHWKSFNIHLSNNHYSKRLSG